MHDDGMKKRLIHILVLSLFMVNIAWAADSCAEAVFGQFISQSAAQSAEDNDKAPVKSIVDYDFCGHCAHASAHLVGLPQSGMSSDFNPAGNKLCTRFQSFYSCFQKPPTQPPKA